MKKILLALAFIGCMFAAHAQEKPSTGDLYDGLTRPLTFNRVIPPYALEVTFSKTVHVIFPSAIRYVDLGSSDLLAAKADGTENVLRVKAALRDFSRESNLSVITEDGAYYSFNVKYADEPVKLSVEMADFLHDGEAVNRPNNALDIYLQELGCESPLLVKLIMQSIYKNDRREIKHIGCKRFGVQYLLKGIYVHNDLLYFHLQLKNSSNVPFNVDYLTSRLRTRRWPNARPSRSRSYGPCVRTTTCRSSAASVPSAWASRSRSSRWPTTSSWSWNCTSSRAGDTRLSRWRMPTWCAHVLSTS